MDIETIHINQIAIGNKIAFKKLYLLYSNKVYATAMHYLQNIEDSQEVTQDVFVKIFNKAHTFKGNSTVNTWIYRIAVNASLNYLKNRNKKTFVLFKNLNHEFPDFEHPGILEENKETVSEFTQEEINPEELPPGVIVIGDIS